MDKCLLKTKIKSSKLKKSLNPIFVFQLIFGYDYGLFRSKSAIVQKIIKVVCTLIVFSLAGLVLYIEIINNDLDSTFVFTIQYCIEALTTIYIFGQRISDHFNRYSDIDEKLRIKDKYYKKITCQAIFSILGLLILTLAYMGSRNFDNGKIIKAPCLFIFVQDISFILKLTFFGSVSDRVIKLRKMIEKEYALESIRHIKTGNFELDEIDKTLFLSLYQSIADQMDDINKSIGFTFVLSFVVGLWKFISLVFEISIATATDFKIDIFFIIMSISLAIHTVIILIMPGYYGENIMKEKTKLQLILANKLLNTSDSEEEIYVLSFLEYLNIRPLEYAAMRIIPVNMKLMGLIVQFCVTILIFIMQFQNSLPLQKFVDYKNH